MTHKIEFEINDEQLIALKTGKLEIHVSFKGNEFVCEEVREVRDLPQIDYPSASEAQDFADVFTPKP